MDGSEFNEGKPVKFLISAPTMRVPENVSRTVHAYLAFRAVILAGDFYFLVYYLFLFVYFLLIHLFVLLDMKITYKSLNFTPHFSLLTVV